MAAKKHRRYTSPGRAAGRWVAQRLILKPVAWNVVDVTIIGREHVKGLGAFVGVANHSSHLDAPLIVCGLPWKQARRLATGVAHDYFYDVWWRRGLTNLFFNSFPIQRAVGSEAKPPSKKEQRKLDREAKREAKRIEAGLEPRAVVPQHTSSAKTLVQEGVSLLVFPEGTRSRDGGRTLGRFSAGAARIAASAEVPILPMAIIGAGVAFPRDTAWPKPGRLPVALVIGEPMWALDSESPEDYMGRVRAEVQRLFAEHAPEILGAELAAEFHSEFHSETPTQRSEEGAE